MELTTKFESLSMVEDDDFIVIDECLNDFTFEEVCENVTRCEEKLRAKINEIIPEKCSVVVGTTIETLRIDYNVEGAFRVLPSLNRLHVLEPSPVIKKGSLERMLNGMALLNYECHIAIDCMRETILYSLIFYHSKS